MKRLLCPLALSGLALWSAALPALSASPATPSRSTAAPTTYAARADAQQWAQEVAQRHNIPPAWLQQQLATARLLPQVQRLMTPAPQTRTTARDWQDYRRRFIDPVRIRAGVAFWNANAAALERAHATYGVPPEMVVGIIGVETIYGQQMGTLRVLDSLSTLAFDFPTAHPRAAERQRYFRAELEAFLHMMHTSGQDPSRLRGSYAGAMGLGQFMPSSWQRWAVDFDGDGRVDLFGSATDAIGSVAHYFQAHGWQPGQPVWFAPQFDAAQLQLATLLAPDILPTFSTAQMQQLGVQLPTAQDHSGPLALVELRNGERAPSYVVGTQNFYAITRYNWSSYYAMAVYDLGQEVAAARSGQPPAVAQPVTLPPLPAAALAAPIATATATPAAPAPVEAALQTTPVTPAPSVLPDPQ